MVTLYSEMRSTINSGDLIAWRVTKLKSVSDLLMVLYRKVLGGEYTHVGIATVIGDRILITEATPPAVRLFPLSMLDDFYIVRAKIECHEKYTDLMLQELGKPYGILDLIKTIFHIKGSNKSYYCSEFASKFYNDIGYISNEDAGLTPDTLMTEISSVSGCSATFVKIDRGNLNGI